MLVAEIFTETTATQVDYCLTLAYKLSLTFTEQENLLYQAFCVEVIEALDLEHAL